MKTTESRVTELRRLRKAKGSTLRALADLCGVTERTMIYWEQDRERLPDSRSLLLLAEHFGVEPREVIADRLPPSDVVAPASGAAEAS